MSSGARWIAARLDYALRAGELVHKEWIGIDAIAVNQKPVGTVPHKSRKLRANSAGAKIPSRYQCKPFKLFGIDPFTQIVKQIFDQLFLQTGCGNLDVVITGNTREPMRLTHSIRVCTHGLKPSFRSLSRARGDSPTQVISIGNNVVSKEGLLGQSCDNKMLERVLSPSKSNAWHEGKGMLNKRRCIDALPDSPIKHIRAGNVISKVHQVSTRMYLKRLIGLCLGPCSNSRVGAIRYKLRSKMQVITRVLIENVAKSQ